MKASITSGAAPAARMSRSPQVSQPRRRLPTTDMCASRRVLAQLGDEAGGGVVRLGGSRRPANGALVVQRLEDQRFLSCPHAPDRAKPAGPRRRSRGRRASGRRARGRARATSWVRRPAGAAGRGSSAEILRRAPGDRRSPGLDELADLRREVLADAREAPSLGVGERRPRAAARATTVSAALRYARILNGFSPLISRRSPISASTRAMARLSMAADRRGIIKDWDDARLLRLLDDQPPLSIVKSSTPRAGVGQRAPDAGDARRDRRSRTGSRRRRRRRPCRRSRRPGAAPRAWRRSPAS